MDHHQLFSEKSELYAEVRPLYPHELFHYLVAVCDEHKEAWDGACGNGQAAVSLANHFDRVQATDISEQQIRHARQHPKVTYSVQAAEETNFDENQFDLVCIAQALHWFDYKLFWPEVKRVLKSRGIFAAWGYSWFSINDRIDKHIDERFLRMLEPYWAPQNKLLWDHYREVPFPFVRIETPNIQMHMEWDLNQLFAYLRSWSAARLCIEDKGPMFFVNAFETVKTEWGDADKKKKLEMDFCLLVGRNQT